MLLSKEIAVDINIAACKLKQYSAVVLRKSGINLTPEQLLLTDLLWNHGPMSQQKVADLLHKDKNSVTKFVDALEKKGLVVRQRDTQDRRSNTLVLTASAQAMKKEVKEAGISMLENLLDGIGEEELRNFLSTLDKLCENMEKNS
ncbi:MAG: MarR family transcriptional regulator [Bacteroidales bacterium]|nr:MarR family transcriptional regulator [Bacteroidales bacterium]